MSQAMAQGRHTRPQESASKGQGEVQEALRTYTGRVLGRSGLGHGQVGRHTWP